MRSSASSTTNMAQQMRMRSRKAGEHPVEIHSAAKHITPTLMVLILAVQTLVVLAGLTFWIQFAMEKALLVGVGEELNNNPARRKAMIRP